MDSNMDSRDISRMPRILLGCVTYDKDALYLEGFMESLNAQTFKGFDLLFIDTSSSEGFDAKLSETGAVVIRDSFSHDHSIKKITGGRQKAREYALEHGYDFLFFVDSDVRLPHDALERLISDGKDIAAGVYLTIQKMEGKRVLLPVVADFTDEADSCRPMALWEVMGDKLREVAWAGFGCILVRRAVLEKVSFRYYEKSMSGEDVAFCVDSRAAGFRVFADFGVKCHHLIFPPGDARNADLDFKKYEQLRAVRGQH
jgi:glycosyltransferase involved in cell wall biosynthesis